MLYDNDSNSSEFLSLVGAALRGQLTASQQESWTTMLEGSDEMKKLYEDLKRDFESERADEFWERGLRVMLRLGDSVDEQFVESVRNTDPKGWRQLEEAAFVLNAMIKSSRMPEPENISNKLTDEEREQMFKRIARYRK